MITKLEAALQERLKYDNLPEPMLFICKDKRIEMILEPHYSLSVIEDKHEIVAFESQPRGKTEYRLELMV